MTLSFGKVFAIMHVKFRAVLNKNMMLMPLGALGLTVLLRFMYANILNGEPMPDMLRSLSLSIGLMLNITMTGILVTSSALAEEKEKHTLRTLMTSSVNGLEFFMGSIVPPLIVIMIVNILLLPASGLIITGGSLIAYLAVTFIGSVTSCIVGMIIGIYAKNQVSANTLSTPVMLLLTFVPMVSFFVDSLGSISKFLYTGVISDLISMYAAGERYTFDILSVIVLVGEVLLSAVLFIIIYKRNGYEKD